MRYQKSLTLVELLISLTLFAIIILGVTAFNMGSRFFLESTDRKVKVLNELSVILSHIDRNVLLSLGDINSPAVDVPIGGGSVRIRQDIFYDAGGYPQPLDTPQDTTDDNYVEYIIGRNGDTTALDFCPNSPSAGNCSVNWIRLTNRLVRDANPIDDVYFAHNMTAGLLQLNNLILVYDPNDPNRDAIANPGVRAHTPVVFNSFQHSMQ
jgi:hypothetical protein